MDKVVSILLVDDEQEICDLLSLYITQEKFSIVTCRTASEAMDALQDQTFDLALLDIMLPDTDGLSLCQRIRETYHFPIIMLTAKDQEQDKILGLSVGADDYITKPFRPLEVIARIKAQLRRAQTYNASQPDTSIAIRGLLINIDSHTCYIDEREINLTPIEFSILTTLAKHCGTIFSVQELFCAVWNETYFENSNNTVMVHIRHIREKMHDCAEHPKYIKTVWGVGYTIEK